MIDDLDPQIQILFANAQKDLANDGFVEKFLANAEKHNRIRMMAWTGIALALALLFWLAAVPLQDFILLLTQWLTTSFSPQDDGLLMEFLAPINSVAGLLALCFVLLQTALRRIWS